LTFIVIEIPTYIVGLEIHIIIKIGIYLKLNDHWFWKLIHALSPSIIFFLQRFWFFLDSVRVSGFCIPRCCHSFLSPFYLWLLPSLSPLATLHFAFANVTSVLTFLHGVVATYRLSLSLCVLLWCDIVFWKD
jgi:hypothetical protein